MPAGGWISGEERPDTPASGVEWTDGRERDMKTRTFLGSAIGVAAWLLASTAPARAADPPAPDAWKFGGEIYLWGASIGAETVTGGHVHVPFDKLLDHLDMGFMGAVGARKGNWTIALDALYLDLSADTAGGFTLPDGSVASATANVVLKGWVVDPSVGYTVVENDSFRLDVLAGARYLYLNPTLTAQVDGPLETRFRQFSGTDNVWNGIVGVRGRVNFCPRWFIPYYADVGAGASNLTWQAFGGLGYSFGWIELQAGYRYLSWDLKNNKLFDDLSFGGPLLGAKIYF
jgi:hypothetical protein